MGLAIAALCATAHAEPIPLKYDYEPQMPVVVRYEVGSVFYIFCPGSDRIIACAPKFAHEEQGYCLIVVKRGVRLTPSLRRHETRHCNGWRH